MLHAPDTIGVEGSDHIDAKTLGPCVAALHVLVRSPFPASPHAPYSVPYKVDL